MQTKMDLHSKKIKSIMEELAKVQSPAPKGKSMYELHCHTTASDGKLTPIELIDVAEKLNIKTIAITDHNTVNGSLEAQDYIKRTGKNIEIINAVEIDACEFKMFHFLAYGIKDMPKMKAFLDDLENKNQAVLAQIIDKLKNQGVDISVDGVRKLAGREKFKKTNIIDYLIENGYAKDWQDVQDRFLGEKCVGYIKRVKPSAQEVIDIIHGCGGVCVLAHPMELSQMNKGSLPNIKTIEKLILELKSMGIDGVETHSRKHTPEEEKSLYDFCATHGLVQTKGNDYHAKPNQKFGSLESKFKDKLFQAIINKSLSNGE